MSKSGIKIKAVRIAGPRRMQHPQATVPNEACLVDRRIIFIRAFATLFSIQSRDVTKSSTKLSQTSLSPSPSPSPSLLTVSSILSLDSVVAGCCCRRIPVTAVSLYYSKALIFSLPDVTIILVLLICIRDFAGEALEWEHSALI